MPLTAKRKIGPKYIRHKQKQEIMKKVFILITGFLILSCNQPDKENPEANKKLPKLSEQTENFDWLLGNWQRLNEAQGKETFENWVKISETEYFGIGYTMQKEDTLSKENMKLVKENTNWNLIVKTTQDAQPTVFTGVDHDENGFACENNENDFPNKIKYWKNGDKIKATISNAEMTIAFEFEKLKE